MTTATQTETAGQGVTAADGDAATAAARGRVTFDSRGETIVGRLFPAAFGQEPAPGVAVIGPMTFQKEQAPTLYAQRLSQLGYTALIFDPRYRDESGGQPRCHENPAAKVADLRAAVAYLSRLPTVDTDRLALLGVCMGAGHALPAATDEPLVRAVAAVAGHYRDPAADARWRGSQTAVAERLARGQAAPEPYQATGQVDDVPAVDFARTDVGMPGELVWSWYQLWQGQTRHLRYHDDPAVIDRTVWSMVDGFSRPLSPGQQPTHSSNAGGVHGALR